MVCQGVAKDQAFEDETEQAHGGHGQQQADPKAEAGRHCKEGDVGPEHDHLAMGKVQDAHDAEHQGDADGNGGIEAPDHQAIENRLRYINPHDMPSSDCLWWKLQGVAGYPFTRGWRAPS